MRSWGCHPTFKNELKIWTHETRCNEFEFCSCYEKNSNESGEINFIFLYIQGEKLSCVPYKFLKKILICTFMALLNSLI
jgi:hypothetical protein